MLDKVIDADAKLSSKHDDKTKTIPTNFNEKKATCKMQNFYILLVFLLITIALLIAVSIYCYLIKYRAKQLLPFRYTDNEFRISFVLIYCIITYYLFNHIVNIKNFDPSNVKIDEKSYKNNLIYYNVYVTIKEYVKIYSLNP